MPVVPVYGQPRVPTAPLPGARFSPEVPAGAFQPAAPPDLSGVTRVVAEIAQQEKQKADQVAVLDADNQLGALSDKILYDPEKGALNARGRNALDASQGVPDQWRQGVSDIEASLKNDTQRLAFRRMVDSRGLELHQAVERHVAGELRTYDDQVTSSFLTNEAQAAITNFADPDRVQLSIARQQAALADYAKRNGMPSEWLQEKRTAAASRTRATVISQYLAAGLDRAAQQQFDAHKGELVGDDLTRTQQMLQDGTVRGESQRQADAIMAKATSLTDALGLAKQIADPKTRDATEQRLRQGFADLDTATRQAHERDLLDATNIVERTHDVHAIPLDKLNTFTIPERTTLERYALQLASGTGVDTDWQTYYTLKSQAASGDAKARDKFLRANLMTYRSQLADTEFKELVNLQANLRKGDANAQQQADGYRTTAQIVNDGLNAAGIDPTPAPGSGDAGEVDLFRRAVDQQIEQFRASTGKPPTTADVQRIVDDLMVQGVVAGSGVFGMFKTDRRAFERRPGESLVFSVGDIPPGDRALIEAALRQAGRPVTDQAVLDMFQRYTQTLAPAAGSVQP